MEKSDHVEGNKTYITRTEYETLRIYVELLEKLIDEEIVIELRDGDLFVDDIKIGYKSGCMKSIGNAIRKTCRNIYTKAATIGFEDNRNKVFYDIIFSRMRISNMRIFPIRMIAIHCILLRVSIIVNRSNYLSWDICIQSRLF